MEKVKSKRLFGAMKPTPEIPIRKSKKVKKEPTMLEYHKARTKKMGMM